MKENNVGRIQTVLAMKVLQLCFFLKWICCAERLKDLHNEWELCWIFT